MEDPYKNQKKAAKTTAADLSQAARLLSARGLAAPKTWSPKDTFSQACEAAWSCMEPLYGALEEREHARNLEYCQLIAEIFQDLQALKHFAGLGHAKNDTEEKIWLTGSQAAVCAGVIWEYGLAGKRDEKKALFYYDLGGTLFPFYKYLKEELCTPFETTSARIRLQQMGKGGRISFPFAVPQAFEESQRRILERLIEEEKKVLDHNIEGNAMNVRLSYRDLAAPADEQITQYVAQRIVRASTIKIARELLLESSSEIHALASVPFCWRAWQEGRMDLAAQEDTGLACAWNARCAYDRFLKYQSPKDQKDTKRYAAKAQAHRASGQQIPKELLPVLECIEAMQEVRQKSRSILDMLGN